MENWRALQVSMAGKALDSEATMIIMAIIVISAERLFRTELEIDLQTLARRLPDERINRVNISSIAAATAINRETVRRKLNDLQDAGLVVRDKAGIRMAHGLLQYDVLCKTIDAQLEAVIRTANQLSRFGVLSNDESSDG